MIEIESPAPCGPNSRRHFQTNRPDRRILSAYRAQRRPRRPGRLLDLHADEHQRWLRAVGECDGGFALADEAGGRHDRRRLTFVDVHAEPAAGHLHVDVRSARTAGAAEAGKGVPAEPHADVLNGRALRPVEELRRTVAAVR